MAKLAFELCRRCNQPVFIYTSSTGDERYSTHDSNPPLRVLCPHSGKTVEYNIRFTT